MPRPSMTDVLFEDLMIPRYPLRWKTRNHGGEHPAGLAGMGQPWWLGGQDQPIPWTTYQQEPQPEPPVFLPGTEGINPPWWEIIGLQGYRGLGQFDLSNIQWGDPSATVQGAIQTAVDDGYSAFNSWVDSYLSGKASSSKIDPVPVENQTTREVLAPVSAALQIPQVLASVPTLQALGTFLQNGWIKWQAFIDRVAVNYPSGANASMARLQPYFSGLQARINAELSKQGATPAFIPGTSIPLPPQSIFSNMSGTTILLLGAGAYLLLRRK